MTLPTIDEIRKQFPGRVPDYVTSIDFIESEPIVDDLKKEGTLIEWLGSWGRCAVGVKKLLFRKDSPVTVVIASLTVFNFLISESVQRPISELSNYLAKEILYGELIPTRYVTFRDLPPSEKEEGNSGLPMAEFPFPSPVITVSVSGSWSGLDRSGPS